METAIWRVVAQACPTWAQPCAHCSRLTEHEATDRFRTNANGGRLDVWLLYQCIACDATRKRRIHRRIAPSALGPDLLRYQENDPQLAWHHAFEVPATTPLPFRVEREGPRIAPRIVLEQPYPVRLRWDRLLAAELAWSRSRVAQAWKRGELAVDGLARPSALSADGHVLRVSRTLAADGRSLCR